MKKRKITVTDVLVKKVVNKLVDSTIYEWPPQCIGFMYQPIRPNRKQTFPKCNKYSRN